MQNLNPYLKESSKQIHEIITSFFLQQLLKNINQKIVNL
jgi:hypothetical protein